MANPSSPQSTLNRIQEFDRDKARRINVKAKRNKPIEIFVRGQRDPRGPDNSVMVWVDEDDQLHIRVLKTKRCYQFKEVINTDSFVEVVAD